jgi:hypothetical protein
MVQKSSFCIYNFIGTQQRSGKGRGKILDSLEQGYQTVFLAICIQEREAICGQSTTTPSSFNKARIGSNGTCTTTSTQATYVQSSTTAASSLGNWNANTSSATSSSIRNLAERDKFFIINFFKRSVSIHIFAINMQNHFNYELQKSRMYSFGVYNNMEFIYKYRTICKKERNVLKKMFISSKYILHKLILIFLFHTVQ